MHFYFLHPILLVVHNVSRVKVKCRHLGLLSVMPIKDRFWGRYYFLFTFELLKMSSDG